MRERLTQEDIARAIRAVCSGKSWTWAGRDGYFQKWRCTTCGREVVDSPTVPGHLVFGPHYKPGYIPPVHKQQEGDTH